MVVKLIENPFFSVKVKQRAGFACEKCGSTEYIQAHAPNSDHSDWTKGIALCAGCHADEHPSIPRKLFLNKNHQLYWPNISVTSVAVELGSSRRTVIRVARALNIARGIPLSDEDLDHIDSVINPPFRIKPVPTVNICNSCGHTWTQNVRLHNSEKCPKCYSRYWDAEEPVRIKNTCRRCGHTWTQKSDTVKSPICPQCDSQFWDSDEMEERPTNVCRRCGYIWKQKDKTMKPATCPLCASKYWNDILAPDGTEAYELDDEECVEDYRDGRFTNGKINSINDSCPACGANRLVKAGIIIRRSGNKQRLKCQSCGRLYFLNPEQVGTRELVAVA